MKKILLVSALAATSTFTFANDNTSTWGGFYAGANLGYGWGKTEDTLNPEAAKQDMEGMTGGFQVGHNWQLANNTVLGLETSFSLNDIKEDWSDSSTSPYSAYYGKDAIKNSGTLTAKAGYAFDKFLPYVTAGVTVAKTDHTLGCDPALVSATKGCGITYETSNSNVSVGTTVGAGLAYKANENLSTSLEYAYTNLGTDAVYLADPNSPSMDERKFKNTYGTTSLKLNYHF